MKVLLTGGLFITSHLDSSGKDITSTQGNFCVVFLRRLTQFKQKQVNRKKGGW